MENRDRSEANEITVGVNIRKRTDKEELRYEKVIEVDKRDKHKINNYRIIIWYFMKKTTTLKTLIAYYY
jgi:hypothetical protein